MISNLVNEEKKLILHQYSGLLKGVSIEYMAIKEKVSIEQTFKLGY